MKKIKGVIDRFEEERVVIRYNGSEVILEKSLLNNMKEGDTVVVSVSNEEEDSESSNAVARDLLKQVLGRE